MGFKSYRECLESIKMKNESIPEGAVALPLRYTAYEQPSFEIVPSHPFWKHPNYKPQQKAVRWELNDTRNRNLYFPVVLRDARRIGEYYPGLSPYAAGCM